MAKHLGSVQDDKLASMADSAKRIRKNKKNLEEIRKNWLAGYTSTAAYNLAQNYNTNIVYNLANDFVDAIKSNNSGLIDQVNTRIDNTFGQRLDMVFLSPANFNEEEDEEDEDEDLLNDLNMNDFNLGGDHEVPVQNVDPNDMDV